MAKSKKVEFINPFDKGVTYEDFLKSLPKGKSISEHLKGKCSEQQIEWLKTELKQFKNK
tara:strand:+ start:580 stop:756 length:177 start_codon:yes stop_codon:yes gene_type:complete